jgi:hypothetical protein
MRNDHPQFLAQHPPFDRERTRKPRLAGGVKGRNIIKLFLTGKPRPVGGGFPVKFRLTFKTLQPYTQSFERDVLMNPDCKSDECDTYLIDEFTPLFL